MRKAIKPRYQKRGAPEQARYERPWRNRNLTAQAKSLDDMIEALEGAAATLRQLRDEGVVLDLEASVMEDDHAVLLTYSPRVALESCFKPA